MKNSTKIKNKKPSKTSLATVIYTAVLLSMPITSASANSQSKQLFSWNEGKSKTQIVKFVSLVIDPLSDRYVQPEDRIVVVDNDGTLWTEKPLYPQVDYLFTEILSLINEEPIEAENPLYKAVINEDFSVLSKLSKKQLLEGLLKPQLGRSVIDYKKSARNFLTSNKHSKYNTSYNKLLYQPMLELLAYLKTHNFDIYIVTGGGEDFVKSISQDFYNIPPSHVIGTKTNNFSPNVKNSDVRKGSELSGYINEGKIKVDNIKQLIGKPPIIAIGNSNGDFEMLNYTSQTKPSGLAVLIHHDDKLREVKYSKGANKIQSIAKSKNWLTVSMEKDFITIFNHE